MSFLNDSSYHEKRKNLFCTYLQEELIMSRMVPAEEFDLIEQVISDYPEGIGRGCGP